MDVFTVQDGTVPPPIDGPDIPMSEIPPGTWMSETETVIRPDGSQSIITRNYSPDAYRAKLESESEDRLSAALHQAITQKSHDDAAVEMNNQNLEMLRQQQMIQQQMFQQQMEFQRQQMMFAAQAMQWQAQRQQPIMMIGYPPGFNKNPGGNNQTMMIGQPQQNQPLQIGYENNRNVIAPNNSGVVEDVEYVVHDDNENPKSQQLNQVIPPSGRELQSGDSVDFNQIFNNL